MRKTRRPWPANGSCFSSNRQNRRSQISASTQGSTSGDRRIAARRVVRTQRKMTSAGAKGYASAAEGMGVGGRIAADPPTRPVGSEPGRT
eukprot:12921321-Heterocapsa_arctica.AAC.1